MKDEYHNQPGQNYGIDALLSQGLSLQKGDSFLGYKSDKIDDSTDEHEKERKQDCDCNSSQSGPSSKEDVVAVDRKDLKSRRASVSVGLIKIFDNCGEIKLELRYEKQILGEIGHNFHENNGKSLRFPRGLHLSLNSSINSVQSH